jgi:tRNA(fMet)-specific endonuclease VapC
MYLLDTNICIALLNGNRPVELRFMREFAQCYTSELVIAELYKGVYASQQVEPNLQKLGQFVELIDVAVFDRSAAEEFGKIQAALRQAGRQIGVMDVLIAAVVRSRGSTVVTHNTRDFEHIAGLTLDDWIAGER